MICADQIPDEAVEAAARALCFHYTGHSGDERQYGVTGDGSDDYPLWKSFEKMARAAFTAGINAWPEMDVRPTFNPSRIILPLDLGR